MKTIPEQYLLAFLSHIIIKVPGKTFLLEIIPLDVFNNNIILVDIFYLGSRERLERSAVRT